MRMPGSGPARNTPPISTTGAASRRFAALTDKARSSRLIFQSLPLKRQKSPFPGSSAFSYPTPLRSVELRCVITASRGIRSLALCRGTSALTLDEGPWEETMVQYIQTMMRKEPITLLVMLLMIGILIFGLWDILHVVKR
jgi:hypothetical protein